MKAKRLTKNSGFSLVEATVALCLIVLAASAIGQLLVAQFRLENDNALRTTAISLAAKELEDLRSLDYPSIPASRSSTASVGGVTYTIASSAAFNQPAASMATITTTVSWTAPLGSQTYTVNAIYTDVTR